MSGPLRTLTVVSLVALGACSCAPPPPAGIPVTPEQLEETLDRLGVAEPHARALRGSGHGELRLARRELPFAHAFVYERPGWLRADVRPEAAVLPGRLTTLLLVDGASVKAFMPDRAHAFLADLKDAGSDLPWSDHAGLLIGAADGRFLAGITDPAVASSDDVLVITGSSAGAAVRAEFRRSPALLVALDITDPGGTLSVRYRDHGWHSMEWLPRVVEITLSPVDGGPVGVTLHHQSARPLESVARADYAFDIPPGTTVVDWRDLAQWTEE